MEEFIALSMTIHRDCAAKASDALEDAGVPFMIEHVDLIEEGKLIPGYRMFVDSSYLQTGMKVLFTAIREYEKVPQSNQQQVAA